MTIINPSIPSPAVIHRPGSSSWIWLPTKAIAGLRRGWLAYVRYKRLASLTDDALTARNLSRGDIGRHAFFADRD